MAKGEGGVVRWVRGCHLLETGERGERAGEMVEELGYRGLTIRFHGPHEAEGGIAHGPWILVGSDLV